MSDVLNQHTITLNIWAKPNASKSTVLGWRLSANGITHELQVAVAAPPEDGKANAAICQCVAQWLQLPKRSITVVAGHTHRQKQLAINVPPTTTVAKKQALKEKLTPVISTTEPLD